MSRKNDKNRIDPLSEMARICRLDGSRARLSAATRGRILDEATRQGHAEGSLPRLFVPGRLLAVAGALPVVLALALLVGLDRGVRLPPSAEDGSPRISAVKDGDRVYFQIHNGGGRHFVTRSTDPGSFDRADRVPLSGGGYTDRLDGDENLVFYRID